MTFTKEVGKESATIGCSNDRIGSVIAQGEKADDAVNKCNYATLMISFIVR